MADTLGSIANLLRKSSTTTQSEVNAIKHAFLEEVPEQKGVDRKARITKVREKLILTDTWTTGDPDIDISETGYLRNGNLIIKSAVSSHSAYPVTHVENGTIGYDVRDGTKLGAIGRFTGSQYVTIPNDSGLALGLSQSFSFWYKFTETNSGIRTLFCKKDESTSTNAGVHIWIESGLTADYQSGTGAYDSDYSSSVVAATVNCRIADGSNVVTASHSFSTLDDGSWHCMTINIGDIGADYLSGSGGYDTDYSTTANETIEIFVDGSSIGSTSNTSITASITNTRAAYFGARDNGGTFDQKLYGSVAWFFWEAAEQSSSQVTDFHSNNIFHSNNQLSAISFEGESGNDTLDLY